MWFHDALQPVYAEGRECQNFYIFLQSSSQPHGHFGDMERINKEHLRSFWMSYVYNPNDRILSSYRSSKFSFPISDDRCGLWPVSTFGEYLKSAFCFGKAHKS